MCAQRKKWSVENFHSKFRKQIFRILFRDLQIIGRHAPANGCSPVPELPDCEAKTPPIPRIASCWLERQQKDRNLQTHSQNQHTRLSRVAPVECVPSPTCAIEMTGELEVSVSAHPLVSASEGPRQLLSYCASRNFTGFVAWLFCSLKISLPAHLVSPLCKPASHQRTPISLSTSHSSVFRGAVVRGYMTSLNASVIRVFTVFTAMFTSK